MSKPNARFVAVHRLYRGSILGWICSWFAVRAILPLGFIAAITVSRRHAWAQAYARMYAEASHHGGWGITGVTNELIFHGTNIEFLAIGSCVHRDAAKSPQTAPPLAFSTAADGQSLYCQIDSGFVPRQFVFGNVAYGGQTNARGQDGFGAIDAPGDYP